MNNKSTSNLHINVLPTSKFKTTTITLKFMAPLNQDTVTERAILSKLLMRATKKWPSDKALNRRLSELYGAYVNSFVSKFKDKHVITISLELVNEKYLKDTTPLFEQGIKLLTEIIWNPLITNQQFDEGFLAQEKSLLTKKLAAIEDNKSQLAFLNLLKNMFGDQPYSQLASGQVENIAHISSASLYDTYQSMITNDFCAIYVVGNVDERQVKNYIQQYFQIQPSHFDTFATVEPVATEHKPNVIIEYDEIDQAKLNMGFEFPVTYGSEAYFALVVFNMMFGGDPSSVLFNEVRERQSLAYSIHSQLDTKNGYLFVLSGVSADKYQVAQETIIKEFEKFKFGEFSDEKLELAKKVIISQRHEGEDRPKSIIERMNNNLLLTTYMTDQSYVDAIMQVTREQIIELVNAATLNTIYILTKGGEA
ncbi:pitrilysin family protein [Staphylococcus arlettae]|uniref:EF-P 5-aminopentanol modification-associated protein YfmF n=1 Tax=Staphylococcus arlettae TaxID=29378 RepID=UPI003464BEFC